MMIGMNLMSQAVSPLREVPLIRKTLVSFSNPILGFLFACGFAVLIQSSDAVIGILQAFALSMGITFGMAVPQKRFILRMHEEGTSERDSTVYTDICYGLEQLIDYCDMIAEALIRYEVETGRTLAENAGTNEKTRQQIHEIFLDKYKAFEREAE